MFTLVGPPRSLTARLATLLLTAAALRLTYLLFSPHSEARGLSLFQYAFFHTPHHGGGTCPPEAWAAGRWAARPPLTDRTRMSASEEAYEFLGFEGCASNRETWWTFFHDRRVRSRGLILATNQVREVNVTSTPAVLTALHVGTP